MGEVEKRGWEPVMEDIIKEANEGPEHIFQALFLAAGFRPGGGSLRLAAGVGVERKLGGHKDTRPQSPD